MVYTSTLRLSSTHVAELDETERTLKTQVLVICVGRLWYCHLAYEIPLNGNIHWFSYEIHFQGQMQKRYKHVHIVLTPLYFLWLPMMFANPRRKCRVKFADDVTISIPVSKHSIETTTNKVNNMKHWADSNRMALNISQTWELLINSKTTRPDSRIDNFCRAHRYGYTTKADFRISTLIEEKDQLLFNKITTTKNYQLQDLLPPKRSRTLRKRGHKFNLPR